MKINQNSIFQTSAFQVLFDFARMCLLTADDFFSIFTELTQ